MASLSQTKCKNHALREAVAKCMVCLGMFCRECVVEHDGRMTCKHCLDELIADQQPKKGQAWLKTFIHSGFALASFAMCYIFFYLIGRSLMNFAQTFYEAAQ